MLKYTQSNLKLERKEKYETGIKNIYRNIKLNIYAI